MKVMKQEKDAWPTDTWKHHRRPDPGSNSGPPDYKGKGRGLTSVIHTLGRAQPTLPSLVIGRKHSVYIFNSPGSIQPEQLYKRIQVFNSF